jgi:nucleotide-binding universal stress UspA family protein
MNTIVVPTDFSATANKALSYAVEIAKRNEATVILLHVCELMKDRFADLHSYVITENDKLVKEVHNAMSIHKKSIEVEEGIKVETLIYDGNVLDAIEMVCKEKEADMIVMGTLGASGLKNLLFGSTTAALIQRINAPLLVIPFHYEWEKPKKFLLAVEKEASNKQLSILNNLTKLFGAEIKVGVFTPRQEEALLFMEHARNGSAVVNILNKTFDSGAQLEQITGNTFESSIQEYIDENNIDLLVMCTKDRTFWESLLQRSKTKRMAYQSNIPLLILKD